MRGLRYWLRRGVVILASADNRPCHLRSCPEPTVGFSVWCREHTDQILEHRESPEMQEALVLLGFEQRNPPQSAR